MNSSYSKAIEEVARLECTNQHFVRRGLNTAQYSQPFFISVLNILDFFFIAQNVCPFHCRATPSDHEHVKYKNVWSDRGKAQHFSWQISRFSSIAEQWVRFLATPSLAKWIISIKIFLVWWREAKCRRIHVEIPQQSWTVCIYYCKASPVNFNISVLAFLMR